jgi:hypothetical protein
MNFSSFHIASSRFDDAIDATALDRSALLLAFSIFH